LIGSGIGSSLGPTLREREARELELRLKCEYCELGLKCEYRETGLKCEYREPRLECEYRELGLECENRRLDLDAPGRAPEEAGTPRPRGVRARPARRGH
jgi:hypothetical protein